MQACVFLFFVVKQFFFLKTQIILIVTIIFIHSSLKLLTQVDCTVYMHTLHNHTHIQKMYSPFEITLVYTGIIKPQTIALVHNSTKKSL